MSVAWLYKAGNKVAAYSSSMATIELLRLSSTLNFKKCLRDFLTREARIVHERQEEQWISRERENDEKRVLGSQFNAKKEPNRQKASSNIESIIAVALPSKQSYALCR
jgi:hypothetical protein